VNYWGSAAAKLNGSRNYAGVSNPAVDALAAAVAAAFAARVSGSRRAARGVAAE
jgi:ABC-type oligopeptide transport system substrate-binding subunit